MLQFYTLFPERKGARFSVTGEVIRPNVLTLPQEQACSQSVPRGHRVTAGSF